MTKLLFVGLGGFVGAILRYVISVAIQARLGGDFPAGTLTVNVLGSFLLGLTLGYVHERPEGLSESARLVLTWGILGSLTTFSTFSAEALELIAEGHTKHGAVYVLSHVICGVLAVVLGRGAANLAWG